MSSMDPEKERMRLQLKKLIEDWNSNRLDLFALSEPNEELEFHGVMRFFFQESGQKVATKCIRVSSTATTRAVIEALIEKFHPDLKMLTSPSYTLWEVHENGGERKLALDEKPLLVQLNWHKDDREGRFLLKRDGEKLTSQILRATENDSQMKRKLSKREKKEQKRKEKELLRTREAEDVATKLYAEVPNTNFTRTISNPEIVMKKRRERKLEQKLKDMGEGGSLKIYGEELSESKPYVTLLVSIKDRAEKIVKETLEKYGLDWHDPSEYCLIEIRTPADEQIQNVTPVERVLDDDDCPLLLLANEGMKGTITFHVRRKSAEMIRLKRRKQRPSTTSDHDGRSKQLPCLVELIEDPSSGHTNQKVIHIQPNVTEVGNDTVLESTTNGLYSINNNSIADDATSMNRSYTAPNRSSAYDDDDRSQFFNQTNRIIARALSSSVVGSTSALYETTFDVDGDVRETLNASVGDGLTQVGVRFVDSQARTPPNDVQRPTQRPSSVVPANQHSSLTRPTTLMGRDTIPAIIELLDNVEQEFIATVVRDVQTDRVNFKLAPAYVVYMCCRYRVSPHYRVGATVDERGRRLADFLTKFANVLHVTIQDHCHEANALAFWMGNSSEILNFLKLDHDLRRWTTPEPQDSLADAVQKAFDHLSACFKQDLHASMPFMLELNMDDQAASNQCLHMLSGAMAVLRVCRVNAALTIQIFSQLFHYVNMYLFNWLVSREGGSYCCRSWGVHLGKRLNFIQVWAEKQGLELAAECRLERVLQAAKLLQASKTVDNLAPLIANCPKLNSFQLRSLLERYRTDVGETPIAKELIENMVKIAESQVDELLKAEGQFVHVEEDLDLQLPFLLPDDGYSPDVVRGLAPGLKDFVDVLLQRGLCRMIMQPSSSGLWTVHMGSTGDGPYTPQMMPRAGQPEIEIINFEKGNGGIGLSIVQAQGQGQREPGIYVKKVVPNSAAFRDGRLQSGDQLLKVNGHSLVGISQDQAAQFMARSGPIVSFEVAKGAALYNGLATWIYTNSSEMESPSRSYGSPSSTDARIKSMEHLAQHRLPPTQNSYAPSPNRVSPQILQHNDHHHQPPPAVVGHTRFPSSSSLQQPANQIHPPPPSYSVGAAENSSKNRSMSAQNLKEDGQSTPVAYGVVQRPTPANHSLGPSPSHGHRPTSAYHQQPTAHDENYYQNITHYQNNQAMHTIQYLNNDGLIHPKRTTPTNNSPLNRRSREGSWHQMATATTVQQPTPIRSTVPTAYTNQEYHQLPQYGKQPMPAAVYNNIQPANQNGFQTSRAPAPQFLNTSAQSLSLSNATTPISNDVFAYPSSPSARPISATFQNAVHRSSSSAESSANFAYLPRSQTDSSPQVVANGHGRYPQQAPVVPYAMVAVGGGGMKNDTHMSPPAGEFFSPNVSEMHPFSNLSAPSQTVQRMNGVPPSLQIPYQADAVVDQRRLSGTNSTTTTTPPKISPHRSNAVVGVNPWEQMNKEEYAKQMEHEVERLMSDEIRRLEAKEFLAPEEQKRYTALRFELEYRRRVNSDDDDQTPSAPRDAQVRHENDSERSRNEQIIETNVAQRVFDEAMAQQQRLMDFDADIEREMAVNELERQEKLERRLEILDESASKRQHMRDAYFEEAEKKLQETAARQRHQQEIDRQEHERIAKAAAEAEIQRKNLRDAEEERRRHMLELNAQRLPAQLQNMAVDERQQTQRTNGFRENGDRHEHRPEHHLPYRPEHHKQPPPEVPPKRRVQFEEAPPEIVHHSTPSPDGSPADLMSSHVPVAPPPPANQIWMHQSKIIEIESVTRSEPPKKYVYQNADVELPRTQVIGAQEVYRDPRQERLRHQMPKNSVEGEKLSFKDKMRLFAKEVGEQTPKDRLKASSAQREIEQNMNVPTVT